MKASVGAVICTGVVYGDTIGALVSEHKIMLLLLSRGATGG